MYFHMHKYRFQCKNVKGHDHRLLGYAGNMLGIDSLHFHFYYGVSSYENHTHYFCGITGFPVRTVKGHIHRMTGMLESNILHEHEFKGYTFEDISYFSSRHAVSLDS